MNNSNTPDAETEFVLISDAYRARVSPYGAALRGFWREIRDGSVQEIATCYTRDSNRVGAQGDVLIPFPGRISRGSYTFQGARHQLDQNDREGPNAIHGFLRHTVWSVLEQTQTSVRFAHTIEPGDHKGYPFRLQCEITYEILANSLNCIFRITNSGDGFAPAAAGFHPYFTVGSGPIDDWILEIPATHYLEMVDMIPTGKVLPVDGSEYDYRLARSIGATQLNTCYLNLTRESDERTTIRLRSSSDPTRSVTIQAGPSIGYFVVFSGKSLPERHRRMSLAIEPMTCGSDGFNHPDWGVASLAPGETLSGQWSVHG